MTVLRERYPATVRSNDDPEKRGRIQVSCVGILGDDETKIPQWIEPALQWGWFAVPDVGEVVDVEVATMSDEDDSLGQISITTPDIKWTGGRYWGNAEADEAEQRPIPEDFTATNYGKRRGFATPGGHVLMFDDTEGDQKVSITWANGADAAADRAFLSFDKEQVILATQPGETGNQNTFFFNLKNGQTGLIDQFGNLMSMAEGVVNLVEAGGNSIEFKGTGEVNILSQGQIMVNAPNVHINAGQIILGDGLAALIMEPLVLGTTFLTAFSSHVHTGPTGPPDPASITAMTASLSQNVVAK